MYIKRIRSFLGNRSGATAIEYALLAGLITLAIVGGVTTAGLATKANFESVHISAWD